jgi:hypothetical protein
VWARMELQSGVSMQKGAMTRCLILMCTCLLSRSVPVYRGTSWLRKLLAKRQLLSSGDAKISSLKVGPTSRIKVAGWNAGCEIHDRSRIQLYHVDRE